MTAAFVLFVTGFSLGAAGVRSIAVGVIGSEKVMMDQVGHCFVRR